jgi:hypothetical protein
MRAAEASSRGANRAGLRVLMQRLRIGAFALRLHRAYRFGLKAELSVWLAKRRWLKASHLPPLSSGEGSIDCFMLLHEPRFWEGVWSLHSFRRLFGPSRLVVLSDGSLKEGSIRTLERLFPGISIPDVRANDARIDAYLEHAGLPLCREWRGRFIFFRKLVDPLVLAKSDKIVLLDSDILHFGAPREIQDWAANPDAVRYIADVERHSYCAAPEVLCELCGSPLPEYFCAGYLCLPKLTVDLARIERYLASDVFEQQRAEGKFSHVAEQTLFAMESAFTGARMLPPSYATCPDPNLGKAVMGHFCGGEATRYWFYTKGLPLLAVRAKP